jgi:hypothetical protein
MWEAIITLAKTPAAVVLVAGIFGLLFYMVKKGMLSYKGKGVTVGKADSESKIRNMQQTYAKSLFESTISDLPKECEYYHKRFVISQCLDEVERMIRENHITSDDCYIDTEFQIIYNIVILNTSMDYFRTEAFKEYLRDLVCKLVKQLENIRKTYTV